MAEGKGGKIFNLTKKRARRVQEKMMQKLGKSDQTRDDVFEDFVSNFGKQHLAATRLQREVTRYMNSVRMLYQSTKSLREVLGELYEPEWAGFSNYKDILDQKLLLWEDMITTLHSKMVEPTTNYIARFPEVKNRIAKRERKVVDYDLTRRELESQKAKLRVSDQKLQQSEEAYTHAKQLYDEITDELYEELPTFYDSRIQFYASIFQSIAATESRFHGEIAKVDEQLAGLMDSLAEEVATGIHSTKKERNVDTAMPKLLSRPGEDSDEESEGESPSSHPDVASSPPSMEASFNNSVESPPPTTPTRTPSGSEKHKPAKPAPFSGTKKLPPTKPARSASTVESNAVVTTNGEPTPELPTSPEHAAEEGAVAMETQAQAEETTSPKSKQPPPKPAPMVLPEGEGMEKKEGEEKGEGGEGNGGEGKGGVGEGGVGEGGVGEGGEEGGGGEEDAEKALEQTEPKQEQVEPATNGAVDLTTEKSTPEPVNEESEQREGDTTQTSTGKEPPNVRFKVVAAHPYAGEDEDELTFEKGTVIFVVPYEDPDDEEEGWLMGIAENTGLKGVFPENFTKRLD